MSKWLDRIEPEELDMVAVLKSEQLSPDDESRIRVWLNHIEETDTGLITGVLDQCRGDPEALAYFLKRADEVSGNC